MGILLNRIFVFIHQHHQVRVLSNISWQKNIFGRLFNIIFGLFLINLLKFWAIFFQKFPVQGNLCCKNHAIASLASRYLRFGGKWQLQITLLRVSRCANSRCARPTCIWSLRKLSRQLKIFMGCGNFSTRIPVTKTSSIQKYGSF